MAQILLEFTGEMASPIFPNMPVHLPHVFPTHNVNCIKGNMQVGDGCVLAVNKIGDKKVTAVHKNGTMQDLLLRDYKCVPNLIHNFSN